MAPLSNRIRAGGAYSAAGPQPSTRMTVSSSAPGLRRGHRTLAWLALLTLACFALTGLLHPLMTRVQPRPAQSAPPPAPAAASLPAPANALAAAGIAELSGLRLLADGSRWLWRAHAADGRIVYLDAQRGAAASAGAEQRHAERLARWYSGETRAPLAAIERIDAFDGDYGYVQRLLPVWRLRFARDDGLVAYVSTEEDRLVGLSDDRKRVFQQAFRAVHSWAWLPAPLRNAWINTLLFGLAGTVLLGLALALRSRGGRRWNLRRAHRWAGVALAVPALAWAVSGFLQARGNAERERADAPQRAYRVPASALQASLAMPAEGFQGLLLVSLDGQPTWRWALKPATGTTGRGLAMGEHQGHGKVPEGAATGPAARYQSAANGFDIADGERRHLAELAAHFGAAHADAAEPVLRFGEDYGFLFKRLPVWRLDQHDAAGRTLFIDTASERLAATVDDEARSVGALFAYAHKWEWVTPWAGKDWRDALSALCVALLLALAVIGTTLRRRG